MDIRSAITIVESALAPVDAPSRLGRLYDALGHQDSATGVQLGTLFHGTAHSDAIRSVGFDLTKQLKAKYGFGVYLTDSAEQAGAYGGTLLSVNASRVGRLKVFEDENDFWVCHRSEAVREIADADPARDYERGPYDPVIAKAVSQVLIRQGFHGHILWPETWNAACVVVYNPSQLRILPPSA